MDYRIIKFILVFLLCVPVLGVGTFSYTESTNIIQVTDGTSGAPATFNDMYTADQAGTGTVLNVAENGAANVTLDYQIRPTHDCALLITCIVTGKTAEADYIFITGTDAWDVAQTESLDVTAGNGSYTTTKRFRTITNLDCSDNAVGGGTVWADGQIAVTQDIWGVVWEFVQDRNYQIDCDVAFGDDSTSTYFQSKGELVYFSDNWAFTITDAATLEIGDLVGSWGTQGSAWSLGPSDTSNFCGTYGANRWYVITYSETTAYFYLYASQMTVRTDVRTWFRGGNYDFRNSQLHTVISAPGQAVYFDLYPSVSLQDFYCTGSDGLYFLITPVTASDIHVHANDKGLVTSSQNATFTDCLATSTNEYDATSVGTETNTLVDPRFHPSVVRNYNAVGTILERYTVNIHVTDKEGNNLSGVNVKCVETGDAGATVFSVNTAADGTITEQTITYKKWYSDAETLTTYSPHEFTFTKAGFEPYKIENVTVDAPIVWEVKLDGANGAWSHSWR